MQAPVHSEESFATLDGTGIRYAVFFQGCPFKCAYCHNPDTQPFAGGTPAQADALVKKILRYKTYFKGGGGVTFSGGEPLMQRNLKEAMVQVKKKGFSIGLHTSGVTTKAFEEVLPVADWVGLDIKAPFDKYEKVVGSRFFAEQAFRSLDLLLQSKKPYEVRTTWDPAVLEKEDILSLVRFLSEKGVETFALQEFREVEGHPDILKEQGKLSYFDDSVFMAQIPLYFKEFIVRRAE